MEIKCTDYLTWQYLGPSEHKEFFEQPRPVNNNLPQWWRHLPGDLSTVSDPDPVHRKLLHDHGNRSARFCLGLRGAHNLGWTIPLQGSLVFHYPDKKDHNRGQMTLHPSQVHAIWSWNIFYKNVRDPTWPDCESEHDFAALPQHIQQELVEVHGYDPKAVYQNKHYFVQRQRLHPAMLQGSTWSDQQDGQYQWGVEILSWPWRAVMPRGWRLLVMAHPLEWSPDWHVFTGCTQANYEHNGYNIGTFWRGTYPINEEFNYYNLEIVLAYRYPRVSIPRDTCVFSAVPVWNPDYKAPAFRSHPSFKVCPAH